MMKVCVLLAVLGAAVFAQPPLSRDYLPPGQNGNGYSGGGQQPSSEYGAPSRGSGNAPSSEYGAPSRGGQSSFSGRSNTPSSQYGAPSRGGQSSFSGRSNTPSSQYGAPSRGGQSSFSGRSNTPSSQYGAPSRGSGNAPSSQYGAPSRGGQSSFSGRSNAPSSQYGAPSNSGRVGGQSSFAGRSNTPSSQYGAPSRQNGGQFNGYAASRGGGNGQDDPLSEPANYEFSYEVLDDASGNDFGHQESRQGDEATGSYHVLLPDGRTQIVDYVANNEGYTPTIRYEEAQGGYDSQGGNAEGRASGQGGYRY